MRSRVNVQRLNRNECGYPRQAGIPGKRSLLGGGKLGWVFSLVAQRNQLVQIRRINEEETKT